MRPLHRLGALHRARGWAGRWLAGLALLPALACGAANGAETLKLRVVGGLAGISQYQRLELPFWSRRISELSGGRIEAAVNPFDRAGLRGQDMLNLMRLGVVPFGTSILAMSAQEEPELDGIDLPLLAPDIQSLRRSVASMRSHVETLLAERYKLKVLGVYSYPAQVLFCAKPFAGLADLAGRRVRTATLNQAELLEGLGAAPVIIPFAEMVPSVRAGVVDCAVTGTLSGNEIGLDEVTTHLHPMALSWGVAVFAANLDVWRSIPGDLQDVIARGVAELEADIWASAERDTGMGIACNVGQPDCAGGKRGRMTLVKSGQQDEEVRLRLLREVVLPRWVDRCGPACIELWNGRQASWSGIRLAADGKPARHVPQDAGSAPAAASR